MIAGHDVRDVCAGRSGAGPRYHLQDTPGIFPRRAMSHIHEGLTRGLRMTPPRNVIQVNVRCYQP